MLRGCGNLPATPYCILYRIYSLLGTAGNNLCRLRGIFPYSSLLAYMRKGANMTDIAARCIREQPRFKGIFQNKGTFERRVRLASPTMHSDEKTFINQAFDEGFTGRNIARLEKEAAEYIGVKHAVAFNSGTAAMHMAVPRQFRFPAVLEQWGHCRESACSVRILHRPQWRILSSARAGNLCLWMFRTRTGQWTRKCWRSRFSVIPM